MSKAFIRIRSLTKSYKEGEAVHKVLDAIDLDIYEGEKLILLGRSGSGKTTLMNIISGIDLPDSGSVIIDGEDITGMSEKERTLFRRKNIGFIFQFFNLLTSLNVAENVMLPLELNDMEENGKGHALKLLNEVGLESRSGSYPDTLSGGEQQRVAIARALAHDPKIILADEPTGNLDHETGDKVIELMKRMIKAKNKTLIMATHSRDLTSIADRVLTIQDGKLHEQNL